MNSKFDYDLLSAMMTNANMDGGKLILKTESYILLRIYLPVAGTG